MERVVVCGSRTLNDYAAFKQVIKDFLEWFEKPVIFVHGGAKLGIDAMMAKYIDEEDCAFEVHEADWDKHGKSAGFKRNAEMREVADYTLAFWDGKSNGTADMIENTNTAVMSVIMCTLNPNLNPFFYKQKRK